VCLCLLAVHWRAPLAWVAPQTNLEKKGLSPRSSKKLGLWMRNFFISKSRLITHSSSNLETLGTHRASFLIGSVRIEDLTDIQDIFSSLSCCQDIVFFRCAGCSFDEIFERFFRRFFGGFGPLSGEFSLFSRLQDMGHRVLVSWVRRAVSGYVNFFGFRFRTLSVCWSSPRTVTIQAGTLETWG
jgi:hypothetical protein